MFMVDSRMPPFGHKMDLNRRNLSFSNGKLVMSPLKLYIMIIQFFKEFKYIN